MRIIASVLILLSFNLPAIGGSGSIEAGEKAYAAKGCIGCHGPAGKSPNPAIFPVIAGKSNGDVQVALEAFRSQKRTNPLMSPMAATLSDADIEDLAAYLSAQK